MGALEQFKQKMAEKRLLKELHPTLNEHSLRTVNDIGLVINTITRTATRTDLPDRFTEYCRRNYTTVVNALNYTMTDAMLIMNRPTKEQLAVTPLSVKDCLNDVLTIIYEPEDRTIFVDKHKEANNLRIEKYVGVFSFHDNSIKLRFIRLTDELDCRSEDEEENNTAKVLNKHWTVEPYFYSLPPNFLDLHLSGQGYEPEISTVLEEGIPPDEELISLLAKYVDILVTVLYSIKTDLNRYCRLTKTLLLRNTMGKNARLPVSVLQMMDEEIEGLNDQGRAVHKQKPVKAATPRKPRIKPKPKKKK